VSSTDVFKAQIPLQLLTSSSVRLSLLPPLGIHIVQVVTWSFPIPQ
jgi:hypothetical protein